MSKTKLNTKPKGMSDKELVKKYESGKFYAKKTMVAMLKTPPPSQGEKDKKR